MGVVFIFTVCFNQDLNVGHLYSCISFKSPIKICTLSPPVSFFLEMLFFKKPGGLFSEIPQSLKFCCLHIHDFTFLSTPLL